MTEQWLTAVEPAGPPRLEILQARAIPMRDDFLNPPSFEKKEGAEEKDENAKGILSVHYEGKMRRIPVAENLGKKIPLDDGKAELEFVAYYPNAKLTGTAQFTSDGDEPKKPLVELLIHLPGATNRFASWRGPPRRP